MRKRATFLREVGFACLLARLGCNAHGMHLVWLESEWMPVSRPSKDSAHRVVPHSDEPCPPNYQLGRTILKDTRQRCQSASVTSPERTTLSFSHLQSLNPRHQLCRLRAQRPGQGQGLHRLQPHAQSWARGDRWPHCRHPSQLCGFQLSRLLLCSKGCSGKEAAGKDTENHGESYWALG